MSTGTGVLTCGYTLGSSAEGAGKKAHLLVSPWKGPNYMFPQLQPEGLGAGGNPLLWDTGKPSIEGLGKPSITRSRKEKEGSLDNYKGLRDNQEPKLP